MNTRDTLIARANQLASQFRYCNVVIPGLTGMRKERIAAIVDALEKAHDARSRAAALRAKYSSWQWELAASTGNWVALIDERDADEVEFLDDLAQALYNGAHGRCPNVKFAYETARASHHVMVVAEMAIA